MTNKNYENYKKLLIDTLGTVYPNYLKKKLIAQIANEGLIINSKKKSNSINSSLLIDISEIEDVNDKLEHILNFDNSNSIYKYIEEFEFNKSYRHSVIFESFNFNENKIPELIEQGKLLLYRRDPSMNDYVDTNSVVPTIKITDEEILIKFSYLLNNNNGYELKPIKYVVLCRFDSNYKILELRFDKAPQGYQSTKDFYVDIVNLTISHLNSLFDVTIENIDFKGVIEYIRFIEDDNIYIYAMEMLRNGSKAYLDAMSNEDMTIPILGEIKDFMLENEDLFSSNDETLQIKGKLNEFVENIQITSDLPSVKIVWPNNGIKVGIKHNYKDEDFSLFMHYDELIDSKERMDNVREYFIESYNNFKGQI